MRCVPIGTSKVDGLIVGLDFGVLENIAWCHTQSLKVALLPYPVGPSAFAGSCW
jgi:hypothetical protein